MSAAYINLQCDNFVATEKASVGSTEIVNDLLVKGNLTVKGDSSIVETDTIKMFDPLIEVGTNASTDTTDVRDRGILIDYIKTGGTPLKKGFIGFDQDADKFTLLPDVTVTAGDIVSKAGGSTEGTLVLKNLESATGSTLTLEGKNGLALTATGSTVNITATNTVINGNLQVKGTQTAVNSTDTMLKDNIFVINRPVDGDGNPATQVDANAGFLILQEKDGENEANPFIGWIPADSRIELRNSTSNTGLAGAAYLDLKCKDIVADSLTATIAGDIGGNAATATALKTPRTIGGVSFNGSQILIYQVLMLEEIKILLEMLPLLPN